MNLSKSLPVALRTAMTRGLLAGASVAVLLASVGTSYAATSTWTNSGTTDWNVGTNWSGGTGTGGIAGAGDVATFTGTPTVQPDMSSAPQSVLGLSFGTTTGGWTLSGAGQTLTIGSSGIDASAQTSGTTTISVASITLGANQTWKVGTGGTLSVGSNILLADSTTRTLTLEGNVSHSGTLFSGTGTTGKGSTLTFSTTTPGTTTGTWTQSGAITLDPRNATTSSATMAVNSGVTFDYTGASTITLKNSTNSSGNANLNISGGTFVTGKSFNNTANSGTGSASVNLTNGGTLKLSAAGVTQLLTSTGGSAIQLTVGAGGGVIDTNSFSTTIDRVVSGSGSLTKKSAGTLTLSGTNTYTGTTTVSGGNFTLSGSSFIAGGASGVTVASGATFALTGTLKLALNTSQIANSGIFDLTSGTDVLDLNGKITGLFDGATYDLFSTDGTINGTFNSITGYDTANFLASFNNTTGVLTFNAVPEPGSIVSLIGGLGMLVGLRRRRS